VGASTYLAARLCFVIGDEEFAILAIPVRHLSCDFDDSKGAAQAMDFVKDLSMASVVGKGEKYISGADLVHLLERSISSLWELIATSAFVRRSTLFNAMLVTYEEVNAREHKGVDCHEHNICLLQISACSVW
jgi:hypothetical protein